MQFSNVFERRLCWSKQSIFHKSFVLPVWCAYPVLWISYGQIEKKKSHNSRVKIFILPNQKYTFAPLFDQRWRRRRSLILNVRIHAHGHCKGHQFLYASNDVCVCVLKIVWVFFGSFFIIFFFDAKMGKKDEHERWLKAFYMWSTNKYRKKK